MTDVVPETDPFDRQQVLDVAGVLGSLNRAGVLAAADVHVARATGRASGVDDQTVLLALALAVRGARLGSSSLDLATDLVDVRAETPDADWPDAVDDPHAWAGRVAGSPLATGQDAVLVVDGTRVQLRRFERLEVSLADRLVERLRADPPTVDEPRLAADLDRLLGDASFAEQRAAADRSARSWTSVLTGGPGTGKTTTIARLLVALRGQHAAAGTARPISVGLAAPTGKAAARMREAIADSAEDDALTDDERAWLGSLHAVTLHRLLGPLPDRPHDVPPPTRVSGSRTTSWSSTRPRWSRCS
ncbi:MAG: AAA family ATPase [Aeromicrobium erythreum]